MTRYLALVAILTLTGCPLLPKNEEKSYLEHTVDLVRDAAQLAVTFYPDLEPYTLRVNEALDRSLADGELKTDDLLPALRMLYDLYLIRLVEEEGMTQKRYERRKRTADTIADIIQRRLL